MFFAPENKGKVIEWLDNATMDKQLKQDREHLLEATGRFQREITSLLNLFLIVANKSLLARDEMGKYVINTYGGQDIDSVGELQKHINDPKAFDSQKRYAELVECILNWDKQF